MLVGYMRVSSSGDRQVLDLQRDALLAAGVDARHLFEDRVTGSRGDRAGLTKALAFIKPGDCLVVWKLDRLGRSLPHLLTTVTDLKKRGIAFRSLTEQMDTNHSARRVPVPHFWLAGSVRTVLDPGESPGWTCRGSSSRTPWRSAHRHRRRKTRRGDGSAR
jgi:DNA invertase Pin-like site-specific DNA recombinase